MFQWERRGLVSSSNQPRINIIKDENGLEYVETFL
jgi:hypothetical protein